MGERANLLLSKENVPFAQLLVQAGENWAQWAWGCPPNLNQLPQAKHISLFLVMEKWSWVALGLIKSPRLGAFPAAYQASGNSTGWA